jgi:hypothetical protein
MKKLYIKPAMSVYPLPTMQLLAGSGLGAGDQGDPSMGAPMFDDDFDSALGFDEF